MLFVRLVVFLSATTMMTLGQKRRCGLPDNFLSLPLYVQSELEDIWKDYRQGQTCEKEILLTDDVLAVLQMFDKDFEKVRVVASSTGSTGNESPPSTVSSKDSVETLDYAEIVESSNSSPPELPDQVLPPTENLNRPSGAFTKRNSNLVIPDFPSFDFTENAPFLEDASDDVVGAFRDVWTDDDIPSEGKRQELIHTLAVSLLTADQLTRYNAWATRRRRVLRQRDQPPPAILSPAGRRALKSLVRAAPSLRIQAIRELTPTLRQELKHYAIQQKKRQTLTSNFARKVL